jgi:hypothetical protein
MRDRMRAVTVCCALCMVAEIGRAQQRRVSTFDAVVAGTICTQSKLPYSNSAQLDCVYAVGSGLNFEIDGVGETDAAILINHAEGLKSDFYFKFGLLHGCVIITRGFGKQRASTGQMPGLDMAFVSPRSGRVYRTWQECGQSGAGERSSRK